MTKEACSPSQDNNVALSAIAAITGQSEPSTTEMFYIARQSEIDENLASFKESDPPRWVLMDGQMTTLHLIENRYTAHHLKPSTWVNLGGRGGFRTPDRWCVKPELYH